MIDLPHALAEDLSVNGDGHLKVGQYELTDLGAAQLLADLYSDRLRYVRNERRWLVCEKGRWRRDELGAAQGAAKNIAKLLLDKAIEQGDSAIVTKAIRRVSEPAIRASLALAESDLALRVEELDSHPYLLACPNGTLDLTTGDLRPHDPDDLLTLGSPVEYRPGAQCPRWLRFLEEVFDGNVALIEWVQRAVGYSLTADTREQKLFVLHGAGRNGKTTFIEIVKRIIGEMATTAAFDSFSRARGDRGPRNDLARLYRARLVAASESGEGRRLDEATVKMLTGGDTIVARFLHQEHFEFRPGFKLWLISNHRPKVDGDDDAIWARLRLIPFEQCFEGREDPDLVADLEAELPGILAWAVEGCLKWQAAGLGTAPAVERATREYREEEDVLGAFLAERCRLTGSIATAALRDVYEEFCKEIGERPLTPSRLTRRLGKRGVDCKPINGTRIYVGLELR